MPTPRKILVTGATGRQGGAVARLLLERGLAVRALTRKPDSPAAAALAGLGAEVVGGDTTDRAAMDRAAAGVEAVFSVGTPFEGGTEAEIQQGVTVADAARAAGAFLVYSSVANADRRTGIPHFDSKRAIEEHIQASGAPATIVAPVSFMENVAFVRPQLQAGIYPSPLPPDRHLAQVAVGDIARVAAAALADPERHAGQRYDLGGDDPSGRDSARIIGEATGRSFEYLQIPLDAIRATMGEDGVIMYRWFDETGYSVDRERLARAFPDVALTSFAEWARAFDWEGLLGKDSGGGGGDAANG